MGYRHRFPLLPERTPCYRGTNWGMTAVHGPHEPLDQWPTPPPPRSESTAYNQALLPVPVPAGNQWIFPPDLHIPDVQPEGGVPFITERTTLIGPLRVSEVHIFDSIFKFSSFKAPWSAFPVQNYVYSKHEPHTKTFSESTLHASVSER